MTQFNKIKILSPEQAIKIAAGEVVERPVNIIKELVENSIDAGATKINIFIQSAGKKLIKIIDNGQGMTPDDAKLSVAPHATSKITTVEDLETIATFGFRGEALASINSVSNLTITTKTDDAQTGTRLEWSFGKLQEESLQSHPTGTTLEIANLFDNIPARQKFLKKDETEWRAIVTLFQAFCLDYGTIHFQLYNEDKLQFNCPATDNISDRAAQLFDHNFQSKIIHLIDLKNKLCSVTGVISSSHYYRYDRNQIFIFVNNRWVKNIDLTKAIMRGYAGTLPAQKYPAAILFITIAPDQVDVNIHPKKEEIKFLHPKKIETLITQSIKATLQESTTLQAKNSSYPLTSVTIPFLNYEDETIEKTAAKLEEYTSQKVLSENQTQATYTTQFDFKKAERFSFLQKSNTKTHQASIKQATEFTTQTEPTFVPPAQVAHVFEQVAVQQTESIGEQTKIIESEEQSFAIIGQYKQTYILLEKEHSLVFVDQHAAHERILYEQFKTNFHDIATIQLMFPEFIKLSTHDIMVITPYLAFLKEHGITGEIFSETQLIIQAMPVHLKNQALPEMIQQIIGWITHLDETDPARISNLLNEKIHTKMACSAAIKAGDILNHEQMQQLLQKLSTIEHRFSCPHGRPTFWVLPIDYLEKQFKRDYGKKAEQFFDFL